MDYFYEHESELFTFYRVPKVLFTEEPFKNMNCEAKLLYGLLLDKMGLSRKSGWFDKQGRAFVYYGISHIKVICQIIDLANRHHIKTVILFGSRARGDFRRTSDIDLAVQGGNVCRFRLDVEEETHTLLTFDVIDLCSDLSPELREAISKEGVLLYEKV